MNEKKFINSWVTKLASVNIKNFPADFISLTTNLTKLNLPGKTLLIGEEFFGKYEIITPDGNSVLHTENYLRAKFILYANRKTPALILIPNDENEIKKAVQKYESYIDSIIKEIEIEYKKTFPEEKNSKIIVSEIFKQLNLVRV